VLLRIIGFVLFALTYSAIVYPAGVVVCPDHGVRSAFTGNRQITFNGSKRHEYCEYTHPSKDLKGNHKFWTDCQ
jgi:putative flippase GtrA